MNTMAVLFAHLKHRFATVALIIGFVVDVITFRNLDLGLTHIILIAHLTIVAGSILIGESARSMRLVRVLEVAGQYSTGSLLSAFLVLYSASGSLVASFPFLFVLIIAILGNEVLRLERYRLPLKTTLLSLNLLLFMALAVPVMLSSIGPLEFFISAAASLVLLMIVLWIGRLVARESFTRDRARIRVGWVSVFVCVVVLYGMQLIPPIPLSLKSAGFYHSVEHRGDTFVVTDEARNPLERFFDFSGVTLRLSPHEPAYVFTAVFAPATLDTHVVHRWEYRDPTLGRWVARNTVTFSITGGRPDGYRLYSLAVNPAPGRYRVSVETARGQVIGRVYLTVVRSASPTPLFESLLE